MTAHTRSDQVSTGGRRRPNLGFGWVNEPTQRSILPRQRSWRTMLSRLTSHHHSITVTRENRIMQHSSQHHSQRNLYGQHHSDSIESYHATFKADLKARHHGSLRGAAHDACAYQCSFKSRFYPDLSRIILGFPRIIRSIILQGNLEDWVSVSACRTRLTACQPWQHGPPPRSLPW